MTTQTMPIIHLPHPLKMTTPTDQKAEEKQWRNRIDIQIVTNKELTDFTLFKLQEYNNYKAIDNRLQSFFQNDFKAFNIDILLKVYIKHLWNMYTFLQQGGVYIYIKEKHIIYT